MARIGAKIIVSVKVGDEDVKLMLRTPSNEELNKFLASRWEHGKKGALKDNSNEARCRFFDELLVGVDNLEDAEGNRITPERKELIPVNWKTSIIFQRFEDAEIDVKN